MTVSMIQDGDGGWSYVDPGQTDLVFQLEAISGLDLTPYDVWLNDPLAWSGHEKSQQGLAALRDDLTHKFAQYFHNNAMLEIHCERYWLAIQAAQMHIRGTQLEHKDEDRRAQAVAAASRPRKKDPLRERIKCLFKRERANGLVLNALLNNWVNGPIDGLRLLYGRDSNSYTVDDENADIQNIRPFSENQFRTIFTEAG